MEQNTENRTKDTKARCAEQFKKIIDKMPEWSSEFKNALDEVKNLEMLRDVYWKYMEKLRDLGECRNIIDSRCRLICRTAFTTAYKMLYDLQYKLSDKYCDESVACIYDVMKEIRNTEEFIFMMVFWAYEASYDLL